MTAWYNEIDDYAADWLENMIALGEIAPGVVDRRSIEDVRPDELMGFTQCHFFAGIGVWSYAARLAGWPNDRPIWTGSCPCQSFSTAGKGAGFADERHLWPAWFHLISQCRPGIIFGEQVEAAINHGWLDLIQSDLEGEGYACGAVGFPSCGIGAPHIRQRLWFTAERLADSAGVRHDGRWSGEAGGRPEQSERSHNAGSLVNAVNAGLEGQPRHVNHGNEPGRIGTDAAGSIAEAGATCGLEHAEGHGRSLREHRNESGAEPAALCDGEIEGRGRTNIAHAGQHNRPGPVNGVWRNADWLGCRDGKWRPVESGTFPLVDGAAFRLGSGSAFEGKSRKGMLKGYGNAINAQQAASFIRACM